MVKKNKTQNNDNTTESQYEKLRDELFQYRVEISSYKKSMRYLIGCVSFAFAVAAFFGYDRIDSVIKGIEKQTNQRLARTDSLLSTVDVYYLDSLKTIVSEKTQSYEEAISALEKGTAVNNELFRLVFGNIGYNKRIESSPSSYLNKEGLGLFEIVYYTESLNAEETGECYVVLDDALVRDESDFFLVEVMPSGRNIAMFYQCFSVQGKYNKIPFILHRFENSVNYRLRVIYIKQTGEDYTGYTIQKPLKINN